MRADVCGAAIVINRRIIRPERYLLLLPQYKRIAKSGVRRDKAGDLLRHFVAAINSAECGGT